MGRIMKTPDDFWARAAKTDECWFWNGPQVKGRAMCSWRGKTMIAARLAYRFAYGDVPDDLCVCHHCDNPLCVRPDHLFLGTVWDNMQDRKRKGRYIGLRGMDNGRSKLTNDEVMAIRRAAATGEKFTALARQYGVDSALIARIYRGVAWPHLPVITGPERPRGGESNGHARLTWAKVAKMRAECELGDSYATLAERYDISESAVSMIVRGKRWKLPAAQLSTRKYPKLSPADVETIKQRIRDGDVTQDELAAEYGVARSTITNAIHNR